MIPVTKPYLPALAKYQDFVAKIYQRQWLTNNGPLVNELELRIKEYLDVKHLLYVSNGTIALQLAIKALNLKGEVITTPFSYVATTTSIVWEGCTPIFADIDNDTLNIDPNKIEPLITSQTCAILATHCFGNACDIERIEDIAGRYKLKVIYDAAHCFGTKYKGRSVLEFGDVSTTSLHATKVMHSIEGGLVVTNNPELLKRMALMRNFGHDGPEKFNGFGINGKNSEFHAAMGLCVLDDFVSILTKRREQAFYYDKILKNLKVRKPRVQVDCEYNYSYYPVVFESEQKALISKRTLEVNEIFCRRYFYPSLSALDYVQNNSTPISDTVASAILCLPLYHELSREEQDMIARILLRIQNY